MPALTATQLVDLVATTLRDLGKPKFTQIATNLQQYTVMDGMVLKEGRITKQSGYGLQWDVMVNHNNSARNVGMYASDQTDVPDTMVQAQADWRHTTASWAIDARELDMNRESARIVDLVKQRQFATMIAMAELMEGNFWGPPVDSTDTVTPWGVNTWIVKNATTGFNGGAPTGYTTIGLNPTTYPKWKNYTAQYTAVTKDDLVRKMRAAATKCNFKPPVGHPDTNTGNKWRFYSNYDGVIGPMEEILESQNENLGPDVAKYDGQLLFRRAPIVWVPRLDADTTNPVYGINWGEFKTIVLSGWWLKPTRIAIKPGQHTVSETHMDCTYQWVATSRRSHFVIATGTTYPS